MLKLWWWTLACWSVWSNYRGGCHVIIEVPRDVDVELSCLAQPGLSSNQLHIARGSWTLNGSEDIIVARLESSGNISPLLPVYQLTEKFSLIVTQTMPGKWIYTCQAYNQTDVEFPARRIALTVRDSPTSVVNVSSGEDFTLSCPVTKGSHVTWYKLTSSRSVKLEAVSGAGQQLTLSGVTQPDSGRYMCEGKGNQGGIEHTQRHYFYLKVTSGTTEDLVWIILPCLIVIILVLVIGGVICWRRKMRGENGMADKQSEAPGPDVVPLNEEEGKANGVL